LEDLQRIKQDANNLKFHLDGARIWNALVAKSKIRRHLESYLILSVCLSKLGAPIGSVLLADKATIHRALRIRKILGGGMQSGLFGCSRNICFG
jgi:threonine aldolase